LRRRQRWAAANPYIEQGSNTRRDKEIQGEVCPRGRDGRGGPERVPRTRGPAGSILDIATGFQHGTRPCVRRGLRVLHVPRHRARGPRVLQRTDRRRTRPTRRGAGTERRSRAWVASACPTERATSLSRSPNGIRTSPRKRSTKSRLWAERNECRPHLTGTKRKKSASSSPINSRIPIRCPCASPTCHKWVTELAGFSGDPKLSNEGKLEAIQMAWLEERNDRKA